ncbi:MAG: tungstate ABC transporter substrate-binding protein WtpA [Planctomycetota bacterium]
MNAKAFVALALLSGLLGCSPDQEDDVTAVSGDLIIFHAGSLSVPFKQIGEAFNKEHPRLRIMREAAGSRTCARKISDLGKLCDVMVSADHTVIDTLLIPEHADWNIKFASNEMSIVFHDKSRRSGEITTSNWYELLLREDVSFGRSDPNADPCGYRAALTIKLAEKYYAKEGLARKLLDKDLRYIRPKEVDLLALLETGEIDYVFLYRSVAEQHGLKYLVLPDEINLKDPALAGLYGSVSVDVTGKEPGAAITKKGAPIIYGVTIPRNAPNSRAATAFVSFLLDKNGGMAIMAKNGQGSVVPAPCDTFDRLPDALRQFARPAKSGTGE